MTCICAPHEPGERKPIANYPINDQDVIHRAYILRACFGGLQLQLLRWLLRWLLLKPYETNICSRGSSSSFATLVLRWPPRAKRRSAAGGNHRDGVACRPKIHHTWIRRPRHKRRMGMNREERLRTDTCNLGVGGELKERRD